MRWVVWSPYLTSEWQILQPYLSDLQYTMFYEKSSITCSSLYSESPSSVPPVFFG